MFKVDSGNLKSIFLSPSEFVDKRDPIGFLPSNPEPHSYLQYENDKDLVTSGNDVPPRFSIKLSEKFYLLERQQYTVLELIED